MKEKFMDETGVGEGGIHPSAGNNNTSPKLCAENKKIFTGPNAVRDCTDFMSKEAKEAQESRPIFSPKNKKVLTMKPPKPPKHKMKKKGFKPSSFARPVKRRIKDPDQITEKWQRDESDMVDSGFFRSNKYL